MMANIQKLIRKLETAGFNIWNPSSDNTLPIQGDPRSQEFYPQDLTTTLQSIAPFVPSPMDVVRRMLELSELKPGEILYDLGCGDGRIVLMAAKDFGSRAVGVDLNAMLINEARNKTEKLGLSESVRFINGDIFEVDLRLADVVTMYLLTAANEKVRPKLESELRIGVRVVTHDFPITKWSSQHRIYFEGESGKHTLYLYIWRGNEVSEK